MVIGEKIPMGSNTDKTKNRRPFALLLEDFFCRSSADIRTIRIFNAFETKGDDSALKVISLGSKWSSEGG